MPKSKPKIIICCINVYHLMKKKISTEILKKIFDTIIIVARRILFYPHGDTICPRIL